jgi:hypothetical protein
MTTIATSGASHPPTLDGLHLVGISADSWEISEAEMVGNVRMASGGMREQRLAPAPGEPTIRRWVTVTLDYRHIGDLADAVDARLAFPGPHQLALWKHATLGYLGDGTLAEWSLPWVLAPHVLTPPAGAPLSRFTPIVRLGFEAAPLAVSEMATAAYTSGTPAAGAVWIEQGGRRFKVRTAPATETRIVVSVVPLYSCVVVAEDSSRRYQDAVREPRRIALTEAV